MSHPTPTVADVAAFLERLAPPVLAESWDNVGLLVGDARAPVSRLETCLTLTEDVAAEAVEFGCELVVAHHPLLFRPVKRVTGDTAEGRTLLTLLKAGIAVISPHTAFDSARDGINTWLAKRLLLRNVRPIRPSAGDESVGGGRFGALPEAHSLDGFLNRVKNALGVSSTAYVGDLSRPIRKVAVACGSAADFLEDAARLDCDVLVTGEARFHACLEARSLGIALVMAGHYATERPGVEELAAILEQEFPTVQCVASRVEHDPVQWSV
jgi:dinuclear metal center YbgI/SA1388 family protein